MCVEQDFSKKQLIVSEWNEHVSLLSFYILLKHNAFSEQLDIEKQWRNKCFKQNVHGSQGINNVKRLKEIIKTHYLLFSYMFESHIYKGWANS